MHLPEYQYDGSTPPQFYEELILFELLPQDRREAREDEEIFHPIIQQLVETYTRLTLCL